MGWADLGRTIVAGAIAHALLILVIRLAGSRTLAKMSAFDLIVTVALGSTLATVLLSSEVSLAEGFGALALLVALQLTVSWTYTRADWARKLVRSEPTILLHDERLLPSG